MAAGPGELIARPWALLQLCNARCVPCVHALHGIERAMPCRLARRSSGLHMRQHNEINIRQQPSTSVCVACPNTYCQAQPASNSDTHPPFRGGSRLTGTLCHAPWAYCMGKSCSLLKCQSCKGGGGGGRNKGWRQNGGRGKANSLPLHLQPIQATSRRIAAAAGRFVTMRV